MPSTVGRFAWSRRYYTNTLGGDPHIEVTLWQLDEVGNVWVRIESHDYAIGLTGLGRRLAERKIRQYVQCYSAIYCDNGALNNTC